MDPNVNHIEIHREENTLDHLFITKNGSNIEESRFQDVGEERILTAGCSGYINGLLIYGGNKGVSSLPTIFRRIL